MLRSALFYPLLCCLVLGGCATATPNTGVRAEFKQKLSTTRDVIIAPLYSTSLFGMTSPVHTSLLSTYEDTATAWLTANQLNVTSSRAFTQTLTQQGEWDNWVNGLSLTRELSALFEQEKAARPEVAFLAAFAKSGRVMPTPILFMEVAYHTQGTCQQSASEHTEHTFIIKTGSSSFPSPCILSHLHAKLVDPKTGLAMWYNHAFGELLTKTVEASLNTKLIQAVIQHTFGKKRGLR